MKWTLLIVLAGIILFCTAQQLQKTSCVFKSYYQLSPMAHVPTINVRPFVPPVYPLVGRESDAEAIHKKLKFDRKLIISGAVLTGASFVLEGVGFGLIFQPKHQPAGTPKSGGGDFALLAFITPEAALFAAGVPLLTVGLVQRHKWRKAESDLEINAGVLPNGHVAFALKF